MRNQVRASTISQARRQSLRSLDPTMDRSFLSNDPSQQQMNNSQSNGASNGQGQAGGVPVPAHVLGLMTNPALAAAAAGSPLAMLSNPAAMLSNPAAYLGMPQAFQQGTMQSNTSGTANATLLPAMEMFMTQASQMAGGTPMNPYATMAMAIPSNAAVGQNDHTKGTGPTKELSADDKAKLNRDRNREHARSTRLRKKAYVAKLKELVEGLHAERTEEVRQRRVAIQHLAEMQNVRRSVVRSFLKYHSGFEADERKWTTLLEDKFWLSQPVTPYRTFRCSEIEKDCRVSRGLQSVLCDAASLSVMIENIGSRSSRWMQIKREEFMQLEEAQRGSKKMPSCIVRQESRLQHAISSLSSSSGSSGEEQEKQSNKRAKTNLGMLMSGGGEASKAASSEPADSVAEAAAKVSSSSGSSNDSRNKQDASKDFHDYHAKPLPDPKLADSDRSSADDSPEESNSSSSNGETKRVSTDSSSGDDSADSDHPAKRRKTDSSNSATRLTAGEAARAGVASDSTKEYLPTNIAKQGGIPHNIQPVAALAGNGTARLSRAPAVALPPFAGIGKKSSTKVGVALLPEAPAMAESNAPVIPLGGAANGAREPAVILADAETSSNSSSSTTQIRGSYHLNEDDMISMDDILMCPFTFRSQDAVMCGALAECVMPGMLRAHFSERNKLKSLELVYDAMGFMQQLERASGNEGTAQIIPGSLEMALAPSSTEARVITLAKAPFRIVNVNEVWTRITGYTQMEVEGEEYLKLLAGENTVQQACERPGKPSYDLEEVSKGRAACMTNIHYDKSGNDFIEFVCSYPLTNANDEVTHLLHISKELPSFHESLMEPAM